MARRDLTLGESFHRTKRTLLLFCAAIVVTRLPGIDITGHSGLLGVSLVDVDIDLVRWLLWVCALYYLAGFLLEATAERQSNSGMLRWDGLNGLADDIDNFRSRIGDEQTVLKGAIRSASDAINSHKSALAQLDSDLEDLTRMARPNASGGRTYLGEQMAAEYLERAERIPDEVLGKLAAQWRSWADETDSAFVRTLAMFEDIKADLHTLARDIVGSRRALFYGWEMGGALAAFLVATWAMPRPFGL